MSDLERDDEGREMRRRERERIDRRTAEIVGAALEGEPRRQNPASHASEGERSEGIGQDDVTQTDHSRRCDRTTASEEGISMAQVIERTIAVLEDEAEAEHQLSRASGSSSSAGASGFSRSDMLDVTTGWDFRLERHRRAAIDSFGRQSQA